MREPSTKASAAQEKAVLSVVMPMTRNTIPRKRNTLEALRLFDFIFIPFLVDLFEDRVGIPEIALTV